MRKKKTVVDSSVIIKWLSADETYLQQADALLHDVEEEKIELYAPELSKYEVGNALLKGKALSFDKAKSSLATFYNLPIQFIPEIKESAEISYQIGKDLKITYYDASFLSLAQLLDAVLVTDNVKHQGKATTVEVIPLFNYPLKTYS